MRGLGGSLAARLGLSAVALALWPAADAAAQAVENLALGAAYGAGVHSFFAGDYDRSYEDLSSVIRAGSLDPRSRYFRGLAALRLGRIDEAEADFSEGAELEARGLGAWPVGRSLERVQGIDRLRLERHRARARVAVMQESREAAARRYSEIEDAQDDVLRRRRPVPAKRPDGGNVFEDAPTPAAPVERIPEPAAAPAEEQPAPAEAVEPPAADGEPAAAAEAPAAEAPAAEAADPFGAAPAAEAAPAEDP
jgi:tetratricopeptide (TPR) repeat protein